MQRAGDVGDQRRGFTGYDFFEVGVGIECPVGSRKERYIRSD
jgi:hypothetical protein